MIWKIRQLEPASKGAFIYNPGFRYAYLPFRNFNAEVLTTSSVGDAISLACTGRWVRLHLHTHAWCGTVAITANGITTTTSLFSEEHGFRIVEIDNPGGGGFDIQIRVVTAIDPASRGNQLWLTGVEFSEDQDWLPRSMPISLDCTLTRGRYGTYLTLTNDAVIGASIVNQGVWAEHDLALMSRYVRPGMTVLDIGANIGHHTVAFSRMVGPTGRVVSVEPQKLVYRILTANCVINGCNNTDLLNTCVGDAPGEVHLYPIDYAAPTNVGALGVDPAADERGTAKGEACRVDRLDTLLAELPVALTACDFVKIDVQSFELFVLKGAIETIRKYKPTMFLEISPHWMKKFYDYKEIYEFLWSFGYEIDHVTDPGVPQGEIKAWSCRPTEEWDVLARCVPRSEGA